MAAVAVLLLSIVISKKLGQKKNKEVMPVVNMARSVKVAQVKNADLPANIEITGKLIASRRIELFAEVNGVLQNTNFKEGNSFAAGSTVVSIDDAEARAQLKAQKAAFLGQLTQSLADVSVDFPQEYPQWKAFADKLSFDGSLPALPELGEGKLKAFLSGRNIFTGYYNLKSQEVRLAKYRITAPFSGVLSVASIDAGALVRQGQKLGEFINTSLFELEAPVSLADLKFIKAGDKVALTSSELEGKWVGRIARINNKIDAATQSAMVYIEVSSAELKEGMYLTATVQAAPLTHVYMVSRKLLFDGNNLYTIKNDSLLAKYTVEVVRYSADKAIVKGLADGTLVVDQLIPGSYENMLVKPLKP